MVERDGESGTPFEAAGTPGDRRGDLRWEPVGSVPRFDRTTDGTVLCVPVVSDAQDVLGYLWASEDGRAAGFTARTAAGVAGRNAAGAWAGRLLRAKAAGATSVEALVRWVGAPGDARSGTIPAESVPEVLSGPGELVERAAHDRGVSPPR